MSYMGLFWETGMPEAWALSRRSGDKPDANMASLSWPQAVPGGETLPDPAGMVPGDNAGRPVPKPDGTKTKDAAE